MFVSKQTKNQRRQDELNQETETSSTATKVSSNKATSSSPTTVELRGIQVHFPFQPYPCQKAYMTKVIEALHHSENALLESPTGTGKTLCLLCSTLSWQQEQARLISESKQAGLSLVGGASVASQNATDSVANGNSVGLNKLPTIIYASRTHSQLSQVVKELRFTRYRPRHAVLGSREQMCIHPKVQTAKATSTDINHNCTRLNKDRKCMFRNNLDGFVVHGSVDRSSSGEAYELGIQPVLDIEELVNLGKNRKVCPFYLSRGQVSDAEIIFVPYNYLFDKDARSSTLADVQWENAVLIFDEAHNLESFASESASFDLSSVDIAGCINEVSRVIGYFQVMPEMEDGVKMENLIRLKSIFLQFENYLDNQIPATGGSFTGEYIFEIFAKGANINYTNHGIFLKFVKQISDIVMEMRGTSSATTSSGTPKLDHFVSCIKRVFATPTEGQSYAKARAYRVHISPKTSNERRDSSTSASFAGGFVGHGNNSNAGRVLSYWCFAPSLAMNELAALNVRSILVTSGTLSPLPSYSLELGIPFPHILENEHIIGKDQISVRVISKGVSGKALTSTYNRRDDIEYITELGNTIISLTRVIPGGVLIFFPSYGVMETCIERWGGPLSSRSKSQNYGKKNFFKARPSRANAGSGRYCFPHSVIGFNEVGSTSIWQRLMAVKSIVLEPKTTSELKGVIEEFDKFISAPKSKGCIMMGVCRGKISEGIDFSDDKCRAVIITGLPYAPYVDPKVKLKREYLDGVKIAVTAKPSGDGGFDVDGSAVGRKENGSKGNVPLALSGAEWYSQQAHRAVNQAIGRVIRHKSDYGAILFMDSRFSEERNQQGVSKWIRPCFEADNSVGGAIKSLVTFFRLAKAKADEEKANLVPSKSFVLKYEPDESPTSDKIDNEPTEKITKVAFVKKVPSSDNTLDGYVPPDHIIKQVDIDASSFEKKRKEPTNDYRALRQEKIGGLASLYKSNRPTISRKVATETSDLSKTINAAWSVVDANSLESVQEGKIDEHVVIKKNDDEEERQNKQLAKKFYMLAKESLNSNDLDRVKKMLIALKSFNESNHEAEYIKTARKMILLLLQYKQTNSDGSIRGYVLVNMINNLLPSRYRFKVEQMSCELQVTQSKYYSLTTALIDSETDVHHLTSTLPSLLMDYDYWKNHPEYNFKNDQSRIKELRNIVEKIESLGLCENKEYIEALKILLPSRLRIMTQLIMNDIGAKVRMKQLKDHDRKKYLEGDTKVSLFDAIEKHHPESIALVPNVEREVRANTGALSQVQTLQSSVSRGASQVNDESDGSKHAFATARQTEGHASKRARTIRKLMKTPGKKDQEQPKTFAHGQNGLETFEQIIEKAKAEIIRKATPITLRLNRKLQSNAPKGEVCNICDKEATTFFMAECNHFSCLDCWVSWLQRFQSCPKCRKPTVLEQLSRVVFEREAGEGAPSLTQMCESDGESEPDSAEDQLEFV